jgi:hypothetical protein
MVTPFFLEEKSKEYPIVIEHQLSLLPFYAGWDTYNQRLNKEVRPAVSLQWIIWGVLQHDIHHGSEISTTLGVHGLPVVELD